GAETALPYGVSMGLMANLAQKRYQGENDIFQVKRKDNEQIYALSLWHRDFYFFNLMPKINVIYKVVNSNIDFYSYDETNLFLSFDKNF
ncbi:MAG: surface lipoprotein assembly modifier, partial [Ewingella sp.]|nr:surface lipoprotein assembly modifier [Ewingella sp.]